MKMPLQITARNFDLPETFREDIRKKAEKLDKYYPQIMHCRVTVEVPHRHHHEGFLYNIRIDITVPGAELVIKREPNKDIYVAIRDAFDAARRKLEDFARRQRGDVKHHEEVPRAHISALFLDKGFGFLTTPEGEEVYFHAHSILNRKFQQLKIGMEVHFVKEEGEKGPQASSVTVIE
ncbi:MAG: HPF/RaiA family ribosome-associated protein [Nitrospirae bacterium]|nr:HPF/RaiA family ribosome-associated protein [Nitrospirota bacterium]